jgi:hypothetical protein
MNTFQCLPGGQCIATFEVHFQDYANVHHVNYYHKFLPNIATEIRPLNELLEREIKWVWNERCNRACLKVKNMITADVVLTHYDPN